MTYPEATDADTKSHSSGPSNYGDARSTIIESVKSLLLQYEANKISIKMVMTSSGKSRDTVYRCFHSLSDLISEACLSIFAEKVSEDAAAIESILDTANSDSEFIDSIRKLTESSQGSDRLSSRKLRLKIIAYALDRPTLKNALIIEQLRLDKKFHSLIDTAKERGLIQANIDSASLATFIQAYSLGDILRDFQEGSSSANSDWIDLIHHVFTKSFLVE